MSVISGKVGNKNTLKITEDAGRRLIALKRSRVPVLTDRQIFDTFNSEAEGRGWKPLKSVAGMKAWLNSAAIEPLWHDAVYGEMSAHQKFDRRHKTQLPTMHHPHGRLRGAVYGLPYGHTGERPQSIRDCTRQPGWPQEGQFKRYAGQNMPHTQDHGSV